MLLYDCVELISGRRLLLQKKLIIIKNDGRHFIEYRKRMLIMLVNV